MTFKEIMSELETAIVGSHHREVKLFVKASIHLNDDEWAKFLVEFDKKK